MKLGIASATLGLVALGACGSATSEQTIVFAAGSLIDAFAEIEKEFESLHPGSDIVVATAGSQVLASQILEGAPAAVFASADEVQMQRIVEAGLVVGDPRPFARNRLAVIVQAGNPLGVATLEDLARPSLRVVLAGEEVPAGRYSRQVLGDLDLGPVAVEPEVRLVVAKIALGEADAGIAYLTDVAPMGGAVEVAVELDVVAEYPIAAIAGSETARELVAFVLSGQGRAILTGHGFELP